MHEVAELAARATIGFALGIVAGSFLAALILRWPEGRSVLRGRSACDGCGRTLQPGELLPILSALVQRGKCRSCGAAIDPLHWRMELACGAVGVGAAVMMVSPPQVLGWMLAGWMLLTLAILDARHYWLPDALTLTLTLAGLTIGPILTGVAPVDSVIGALAGYGVLMAVALFYRALRGREGLGLGDAKLLGALGAWMGWQALPLLLCLACALGLLWIGARALIRSQNVNAAAMVPLGTFLCLAAPPVMLMRLAGWIG